MEERETDRLIADFLAITLGVAKLLHEHSGLTTQQMDCLSNTMEGLTSYLAAWKQRESVIRDGVDQQEASQRLRLLFPPAPS
jgi:hypothetical protein